MSKLKFVPITCNVSSSDAKMFTDIINQGIDSHLEAFTKSKFDTKVVNSATRLILNFEVSELPILVRRLEELETENGDTWASDIRELKEFSE